MTVKLKDLVAIRAGVTFRGRDAMRTVTGGSCGLVRIGDVSSEGTWLNTDFVRVDGGEQIHDGQCLASGDVLFPNRGTRVTAIVFRLEGVRAVVGTQFFVIRSDAARLWPEYLAWFLRTEGSARYFAERRKGTYVQVIERRDLEELELPVPPLDVQRKIAEADRLACEARILDARLAVLKAKCFSACLVDVAKAESESEESK